MSKQEQEQDRLPGLGADIWSQPVPPGYRRDSGGNLVRVENIRERDLRMDQVVSKIFGFAEPLRDQLARFRGHTEADINDFVSWVIEDLGGKVGGKKGNLELKSFDGTLMVRVAQGNYLSVGPEIAAVQSMMDEMLNRLGKGAPHQFRALVDAVLRPREGEIAVHKLLSLARVEIDDEQWPAIQAAIREAVRPSRSAEYVRLYRRQNPDCQWVQMALNLSTIEVPDSLRHGGADPLGVLHQTVAAAIEHAQRAGVGKGAIARAMAAARRGEALPGREADDE